MYWSSQNHADYAFSATDEHNDIYTSSLPSTQENSTSISQSRLIWSASWKFISLWYLLISHSYANSGLPSGFYCSKYSAAYLNISLICCLLPGLRPRILVVNFTNSTHLLLRILEMCLFSKSCIVWIYLKFSYLGIRGGE